MFCSPLPSQALAIWAQYWMLDGSFLGSAVVTVRVRKGPQLPKPIVAARDGA